MDEIHVLEVINTPYVPGFLAFREAPVLKRLLEQLKKTKKEIFPQVLLVDGNGILHPHQCGLACHLGVQFDIPTIGCAKSVFAIDGITKARIKINIFSKA